MEKDGELIPSPSKTPSIDTETASGGVFFSQSKYILVLVILNIKQGIIPDVLLRQIVYPADNILSIHAHQVIALAIKQLCMQRDD
jgi:hypothetical protein